MEKPEINLSKCRKCGALKLRIQDGEFDNGNKRWVDDHGKQWSGRTCPTCHKDSAKERAATKRTSTENRTFGIFNEN